MRAYAIPAWVLAAAGVRDSLASFLPSVLPRAHRVRWMDH
jgi:hypothetical protein